MRTLLLIAVAALVVALGQAAAASPGAAGASRSKLTVGDSQFGRILFDGRGFALYAFTRDRRDRTRCSGACAAAWPPYTVDRKPRAGKGVAGRRLGTIRRADGSLQVTYAGRPLYYYVGDRSPGQVLCQNVVEFGGTWLVVRADGSLVV
jgi:predicted lipoprotein with Yx(FWY)xxD motif